MLWFNFILGLKYISLKVCFVDRYGNVDNEFTTKGNKI